MGGIESGRSLGVVLTSKDLPDLASIIYFAFDKIAVYEGQERSVNLGQLYPRVTEAVALTRVAVNRRWRMKEIYPNLGKAIKDPCPPDDPGKVIDLVINGFNPREAMKSLTSRSNNIAESTFRSTTYGLVRKRLNAGRSFI